MAYNLAQLRTQLSYAQNVFPAGATTPDKNVLINRARERIFNTNVGGGWKGGDATLALAVVPDNSGNNTVTMPYGFESIVGVYDGDGDFNIQNEWWAFTRMGNGPFSSDRQLQDQGDGFTTFIDLPAAGIQPRFITEGPATITLIGFAANGDVISETVIATGGGTWNAAFTYVELFSLELNATTSATLNIYYITPAPSAFTDFSMFPGGMAPSAGGLYLAEDSLYQWSFVGGQAQWRRSNLESS